MVSIASRNLDDDVKLRLSIRGAEHRRSLKKEASGTLGQVAGGGKARPQLRSRELGPDRSPGRGGTGPCPV